MKMDKQIEKSLILDSYIRRRKSIQNNEEHEKQQKREALRRVSLILQKAETQRTPEEVHLLESDGDIVKQVRRRQDRVQRDKDRVLEKEDPFETIDKKAQELADILSRARHLICYTGAGISTSARIPDYRGSQGIWTLLQKGQAIGQHDLSLADPTYTHMALYELHRRNILQYVLSQNCDGLHLRSGLPRHALSEVHGNMYVEVCKHCKPNREYWRLFDTTELTARYNHKTNRRCHECGKSLVDTIVHFGERGSLKWPLNWDGACRNANKADVILCLGSSLKVLKKYPWLWQMDRSLKKRPKIYIVNLQWTPKDSVAAGKIHGKCDEVMRLVMKYMGVEVPPYSRERDPIFAHANRLAPEEMHTVSQPMLKASKDVTTNEEEEEDATIKDEMKKEETIDDLEIKKPKMEMSDVDGIDSKIDLKYLMVTSPKTEELPDKFCEKDLSSEIPNKNPKLEPVPEPNITVETFTSNQTLKHEIRDGIIKNEAPIVNNSLESSNPPISIQLPLLNTSTSNEIVQTIQPSPQNKTTKDIKSYNTTTTTSSPPPLEPLHYSHPPSMETERINFIVSSFNPPPVSASSSLSEPPPLRLFTTVAAAPTAEMTKCKFVTSPPKPFCDSISNSCSRQALKPFSALAFGLPSRFRPPSFIGAAFERPPIKPIITAVKRLKTNRTIDCLPLLDQPNSIIENAMDSSGESSAATSSASSSSSLSSSSSSSSALSTDDSDLSDYGDYNSLLNYCKAIQNATPHWYDVNYAYSGLHSIIHPPPTEVNIWGTIMVPLFKLNRKLAECEFCFDNYAEYKCQFYINRLAEFKVQKYRGGRLIVCDCCDYTDDESGEIAVETCPVDNVTTTTTATTTSTSIDTLENVQSEMKNDDNNYHQITVNYDDNKSKSIETNNGKCAKLNGVPTAATTTTTKVQAGWYGKGYRKMMRRKRRTKFGSLVRI